MKHLNGNILCVLDTETTGLRPRFHDIIEVCVLPLDNDLSPSRIFKPFAMQLKPKRPENFDPNSLKATDPFGLNPTIEGLADNQARVMKMMTEGMDAYMAADLFMEWYDKFKLPPRKRLMPIACNFAFDREFLIDWLGIETWELVFDPRYRDVMSMSLYENDVADWNCRAFQYPKNTLQYLCSQLGVERPRKHTAFDDCVATARIYKKMIQQTLFQSGTKPCPTCSGPLSPLSPDVTLPSPSTPEA